MELLMNLYGDMEPVVAALFFGAAILLCIVALVVKKSEALFIAGALGCFAIPFFWGALSAA